MRYVRKAPAQPVEPDKKPDAPVVADSGIAEALQAAAVAMDAMRQAAERLQPAPAKPEQPAPTAFTCTVTERDSKGRITKFDIAVKREIDADPFENGFASNLQ